jgi:catechol 2,3-dioxygenase-like lactoylglutathione lyase family enzyme
MTDFTVVAVRYTDDVPRMARFLDAVGLSRRISSSNERFVDFVAGNALVMLHNAADGFTHIAPGGTELAVEVSDLDATVAFLRRQGFDPLEWDESYGRHAAIRDPRGDGIWITERMRDFYGYRRNEPQPNDLNLIAVRFSATFAADTAFFARLGFSPRRGASEHWTALELVGTGAGVIGLHPVAGALPVGPYSAENPAAPPALIDLGFETHEPPAELVERLRATGLSAELVGDGPALHVDVTDPEGLQIQIHTAP